MQCTETQGGHRLAHVEAEEEGRLGFGKRRKPVVSPSQCRRTGAVGGLRRPARRVLRTLQPSPGLPSVPSQASAELRAKWGWYPLVFVLCLLSASPGEVTEGREESVHALESKPEFKSMKEKTHAQPPPGLSSPPFAICLHSESHPKHTCGPQTLPPDPLRRQPSPGIPADRSASRKVTTNAPNSSSDLSCH